MQRVRIKLLLFLILVNVWVQSCKHHATEDVIPVVACDTSNVTYNKDIAPILKQKCGSCHSGAAATAGLDLEQYQVAHDLAVSSGENLLNVTSGNPDYIYMPPAPNAKLSACEVAKVRLWSATGAPHN